MNRIVIPALCAIVIAGGIYWFATHEPKPDTGPKTAADLFGTSTESMGQTSAASQSAKKTDEGQALHTNDIQNVMSATLHTNMGDITIEFNPETPNTAANFIKLAKSGFYDGTKFHRVIKGFMNQGGDPLSKDDSLMARWGTGGPEYQFADEITPNNDNAPGTISMANAGPNTNGSQFFINAADNSFLNDKHTAFGRVTKGLDVVMAINSVPTGEADRPLKPVILESVTLE